MSLIRSVSFAFLFAACASETPSPREVSDALGDSVDASDVSELDVTPDAIPDTASDSDTAPDILPDTDTVPDTAPDTDTDPTIVAVPGERCALADRIGLVQLELSGGTYYLSAAVEDRPTPWYGAPELTTEACAFHRFNPSGACPPCGDDELCGIAGSCTKAPVRFTDSSVTLTAGAAHETFTADPTTGDVFGTVTLPGPSFALELTFGDVRILVDTTSAPDALADLVGTLEGGYDAPTRLDVAWSTSGVGTHVFTHIPINHHAGGPTFTECTVPATSGGFTVGEAMLTPLAVSTGLEFQGIEHVRFAAAETPAGCVEVRFTERHYLNLF